MELYELTIHELLDLIKKRETTPSEITESVLKRVGQVEDRVKAFVTITEEEARERAKHIDEDVNNEGNIKSLMGIPMALKDNMCTKGIRTTCSSKILYNFKPPYNATVVEKLNDAGTVLIGKTNLDEFAMGSSTENSAFHTTRNPWDLKRVPGGSSGGSAAAVAADEVIFALGSDTGGSIRQPASLCGVVGMKPTYGFVSRYGLIAFASSLDQIGPFTKDVTDCAIVMNAICGHDPMDSTSANVDVPDFTKSLVADVKGMKIGVPKEYFIEGIQPEVKDAVMKAAELFEEMGANVEDISLPHTDYGLSVYYIIAPAEASSNLARYDGIQYGFRAEEYDDLIDLYKKTRSEGFGPEVKRRIMLGTYALSSGYYDAYYLKAQKVRTLVKQDFDNAFEKCDIIICPTSPTTAFEIGAKTDDPLAMYLSDVFTIPVNLAGIPGISIPCGFSNGLPIGLQIIGKPFDEATIIKAAYTFEQATDYHKQKPNL
ncbi:MAG: aspartyl-tRNA(Asn)/glutamyl-tRNA(Gln) amidotransferase subunit [Thermosediminibacterales bacterium]|nr:aspartyl-tRNA(Asn)/glutamyl-tRNA(Gln) amidotransferase subunit [Thermosediminibacterales bacterium]MDK2836437.1 aspartyl-tRNA(Asn)/glutamyl-tRNA(Gln) amidotransferase subunit [Thermosediminibacterales bacterium]